MPVPAKTGGTLGTPAQTLARGWLEVDMMDDEELLELVELETREMSGSLRKLNLSLESCGLNPRGSLQS